MNEDERNDNIVDLDEAPVNVPRPREIQLETISINQQRESKRGEIAIVLLWVLVLVTISPFLAVLIEGFCFYSTYPLSVFAKTCPDISGKYIKDILQIILTPLVALVGAVTGFYFGERKSV